MDRRSCNAAVPDQRIFDERSPRSGKSRQEVITIAEDSPLNGGNSMQVSIILVLEVARDHSLVPTTIKAGHAGDLELEANQN